MSWEAAADLVVHMHSLASRDGSLDRFKAMLDKKWAEHKRDGAV